MRYRAIHTTIMILVAAVTAAAGDPMSTDSSANAAKAPALEIGGFIDCIAAHRSSSSSEPRFSIGQAEVDLWHAVSPRIETGLAIAYNSESGHFELGSAEMGFLLFERDSGVLQSLHVVAGQFDVPFGLDYRHYASIDRETVTAPWHNHTPGEWCGWNDLGVRLEGSTSFGNLVAFAVNGFSDCREVTHRVFNLATSSWEDSIESIEIVPEYSIGERTGIRVSSAIEVGSSLATAIVQGNEVDMVLAGGDISARWHQLSLRGEYIRHWRNLSASRTSDDAFYGLLTFDFGRVRLHSRFAAAETSPGELDNLWSIGAAVKVHKSAEIRSELLLDRSDDRHSSFLQLVVGF